MNARHVIDHAATAIIVVDPQNDFVDPAGSLPVPGALAAIYPVNRLTRFAERAGWLVVATADWHPPRTPHFATDGGPWPVHCVRDTWGAAWHGQLHLPEDTVVVRKGTGGEDGYSGFSMTDNDGLTRSTGLHEILTGRGIRTLLVTGFATDYCVKATVLDALSLGYETLVVFDAIAAVNLSPTDGDDALIEMRDTGAALVDSGTCTTVTANP